MKLTQDDSVRYLIKNGDQVRGPFLPDGLESLAYLHQVTPDTLVRREDEEAFTAIKDTPLCAVLFPKYVAQSGPAGWGKPGKPSSEAYTRKQFQFREARFERVNSDSVLETRVEVTEILGEVRQMERDAGLDFIRQNRFKVSRRTKDFWIMLIAGNGLLLGGAIAMHNLTSFVFAFAGMGLFTFGLLWSMYGVMGKY